MNNKFKNRGGNLRYIDIENQELPRELRTSSRLLNPYDAPKIELNIEENDIINFLRLHFDSSMFQNFRDLGLFVVDS